MNTIKEIRRGRFLLIAVAVLCFLPFVSAIVVTKFLPEWSPFGTANNGELVSPIVAVSLEDLVAIDGAVVNEHTLRGKWSIIMFSAGPCSTRCLDRLDETGKMRLLLNKDVNRLQRILVFASEIDNDIPAAKLLTINSDLKLMRASSNWRRRFTVNGETPERSERIFLVDPQGYFMMSYTSDIRLQLIHKDLKRLLKASRVG